MSDLFMEGMGCEPTAFKEIGVKVPKMGILTTKSQKSFNLARDASMKSGTFKLSYDANELS